MSSCALSILAFDINNDGWTDLAASYPDSARLVLNTGGHLEPSPSLPQARGPLAFADFENRALADLVTGAGTFRNQGIVVSQSSTLKVPVNAVALAVADFNNDGRMDAAGIEADGSIHLYFNETETTKSFIPRIGHTRNA